MKKLVIKQVLPNREIIHFAEAGKIIGSRFNQIFVEEQGVARTIVLPRRWWEWGPGSCRLLRRALRLDKCNVFPVGQNLVIIRGGMVYHHELGYAGLRPVLRLRNCRNVLHQSITATPDGSIYFGEYGANRERRAVPVHRSVDGGMSWATVYEFMPGEIKHVHGCYYDRHEDSVWVCTGDFAGENRILRANRDFSRVEQIGDGSQKFRTCNFFFTPNRVYWLMDSQLETSHVVAFDRATRQITIGEALPGPVWYVKELADGYYLAGTAQEIGPGVRDKFAHLLVSRDLAHWEDLHLFSHDGWPMRFFKFGVMGFADGVQDSSNFPMFFEAIEGLDGCAAWCKIADHDES